MKALRKRIAKLEEKHSQAGGRYPIFFLNRTSQNEYLLDMEQHEKILFDTKSDVERYIGTKSYKCFHVCI